MFEPSPPPSDPKQFGAWAMENFVAMQRALNDGIETLTFPKQYVAPSRPREGMVVNADGVTWNPGGGAGLYQRLGGAWVKL